MIRGIRYASERAGLVMTGACLLVIAFTVGLLAFDQKNNRAAEIRARGISLVRLLAGMPSDRPLERDTYQSMLQLVSFSQGTQDFAYVALVDRASSPIAEVAAAGVIVPVAPIVNEPSGWIGERTHAASPGQRAIMEYYAPVFEHGDFAGQIRLGFYAPSWRLLSDQIPMAATLALSIFLLTPLFYYLLRREIRPLAAASAEIETLLRESNDAHAAMPPLHAFAERFNHFVARAHQRIHELEAERNELLASAKLISYKKSRIDTILQTLPDGVLVLDEHGKVTYANERVTTLLRTSKEEILAKAPREWCSKPEVADFISGYEAIGATRYVTDTLRVQSLEDGQNGATLALNGYPLFSPRDASDLRGTLIVIRDVTEETLAQANRTEFVAHLGHELKTPLNTLALYSEMLLDKTGTDEAERIAAVNTIHDEVERLVSLVNNLMSITKLEMGGLALDKQRIRLPDLLEDICVSLGRAATQNGIVLETHVPRHLDAIYADKDLLRIAINNLVSNAIKYNHSGGRVSLDVEDTAEALMIRVSDTGIGISAEDQARIFDKFFRSESSDVRLRSGHGLGLSLAREIVQRHGGELTVESTLGNGATFTIALSKRFGLIQKAI